MQSESRKATTGAAASAIPRLRAGPGPGTGSATSRMPANPATSASGGSREPLSTTSTSKRCPGASRCPASASRQPCRRVASLRWGMTTVTSGRAATAVSGALSGALSGAVTGAALDPAGGKRAERARYPGGTPLCRPLARQERVCPAGREDPSCRVPVSPFPPSPYQTPPSPIKATPIEAARR